MQDLVLKISLFFLKDDGLFLLSLAFLGVLEVFFFAKRARIADFFGKVHQGSLDLFIDLLSVMAFDVIVMGSLSVDEIIELIWLSLLFNMESEFALHLIESLVDVHEFCEEVRSAINELSGQILSDPVVKSVADIALPEAEDFADEVVLEELHAGQHIEHGRLLHPFW